MNDSVKSRKAEWLVTLPSLAWLLLFFAVPALIVLAFTFHGHTANGGVGEWSLSTWRVLVDPDYPTIVWKTIRISFEVTGHGMVHPPRAPLRLRDRQDAEAVAGDRRRLHNAAVLDQLRRASIRVEDDAPP